MKAAIAVPVVLVNLALLGTCAKMYWYDHLPLPATIATVVIIGIVLNTIVVRAVRRVLQKADKPDKAGSK